MKLPAFISPALALPAGILAIIILMVVPIPSLMLDLFFVLNIALSVSILMAAMNAQKPLDFSSFPSVLLIATGVRTRKDLIPFGPYLAAGAFLALFVGQAIADAYLRTAGFA